MQKNQILYCWPNLSYTKKNLEEKKNSRKLGLIGCFFMEQIELLFRDRLYSEMHIFIFLSELRGRNVGWLGPRVEADGRVCLHGDD